METPDISMRKARLQKVLTSVAYRSACTLIAANDALIAN